MICLGVDPDLHTTALALADETRVYAVHVVRVPAKLKGAYAVIAMAEALGEEIEDFLNQGFLDTGDMGDWGAVVEGQELYLGGGSRKSKPEDLLNLANVTGAAIALVKQRGYSTCLRPLPKEWKGSVPKVIHQARTCTKLGWVYKTRADYVVPDPPPDLELGMDWKESDWKHALDAIGLARWGATRCAT